MHFYINNDRHLVKTATFVCDLLVTNKTNGKYVGYSNETSISYIIEVNVVANEYFFSNTYNCRIQVLISIVLHTLLKHCISNSPIFMSWQ